MSVTVKRHSWMSTSVLFLILTTFPAQSQVFSAISLPWRLMGGPYELPWSTISSGGSISTDGVLIDLRGTIGQPVIERMSGEIFTLEGGFWPAIVIVDPVIFNDGFESGDTSKWTFTEGE